jgi:4-amino-4-deoxy-L-arabinose transferase-like glycosyltransferase
MSRLIGPPPNTPHSSASAHSEGRRYTATSAKLVLGIAAFKLLVHLYAGRHYGYFVDELYYLACSRRLDWGYVDQPPLIALITWIARSLLGDSLPAIRFLPAVAGAVKVGLTALLARELGGRLFAQGLAAIVALVAPGFLAMDNLLSMNTFEGLFWLICAWLLTRIIKSENQKLWIWFGIGAGVGLQNKHSMLIFGSGVILGLFLTPQRRWLADRWLWISSAIAFLIFAPNLLWNIHHQFPFLELQGNISSSGRNVSLGPMAFFGQQILTMHPLALPIWLAGLWFYFFSKAGKPHDGNLRPELRPGWCGRSFRSEIRLATGDQRAPELFPLGTARLHRRKCHRDAGAAAGARRTLRKRAKGRHRLSPLLYALPVF